MALKKNDFIEMKFTGRLKDTSEIFDSNIEADIKESGLNLPSEPIIFSLGEDMFLKGIDEFLVGKEPGKYSIELSPEKAFGMRDSKLIQMIPIKAFKEQKINPFPGAVFNFDGRMAKVLTVSGGRVIVDFNNPVAGKTVIYNIEVTRKIDSQEEKIKALNQFFFKKDFRSDVKEKKLTLHAEKPYVKFIELFADKYKDILGLELEVKALEETGKKTDKTNSKTQ